MILNEIFIKLFFMGMIFVVFSCATIKDENYINDFESVLYSNNFKVRVIID